MLLKIDEAIFNDHRNYKLGAIIIKDFDNSKRVSSVEALLRGTFVQRKNELKNEDVLSLEIVQAWDRAIGNLGINPEKNHPFIKAMFTRLKQEDGSKKTNLIEDISKYFALKYKLPIFALDIDWLCGELSLKYTKGNEPFRAKDSITVENSKEGEPAYIDSGGIISRYWNHKQCQRTRLTTKTRNAVFLIEDLNGLHMDLFGSYLREMQSAIMKYLGGYIEPYILTEESAVIDLGVQGRTSVDDSKVPQQEKAHFMKNHTGVFINQEQN